ncbi:MAG: cytochrome c oxidase accessory protein CcoG [Bdellovibrionaceae bacterium]|nr:cytochrome c oxidase accessory protein CcoG [Pseudobdellovibrionaceae bacterium]|tara:strand:- start:596 stop:1966 length:1371 start_codon:yes stop_codon:yes gene_type:complete
MSEPNLDSIASLDEWGARKTLIPLDVHGKWKTRKTWIQWALLLFFLVVPWIKINGNPVILLNIGERRFSFFGYLFFAHDGPLIFFILALSVLGLAFVTSVWGRVWCGYACPQTVFIEQVYRRIESWIEGSPLERRKNLRKPMTGTLAFKKGIKWFLFFVVSSVFAHSFAAYFVGAEPILQMIQQPPHEHWTVFLVVTSITALLLFDFGWFREQFCIIMCPYGRFQSVLMDDRSLAVIYDEERGEPRKGVKSDKPQGDCINCKRCVEVCPTGIDIRQGVQMECIACTACIDACDEIMTKVKKPLGLIRYDNVVRQPLKIFKPRSIIYMTLLAAITIGLVWSVSQRKELHVTLLRAKDTPYQMLNDQEILNHFKLHITNQSGKALRLYLKMVPETVKLVTQVNPVIVGAQKDNTVHFFTRSQRSDLSNGAESATIQVFSEDQQNLLFEKALTLLGPKQ